ncbi:TOMM precursor leader peptide-binding protein [Streptomyces sp. SP18CS02]|uniref:TOMM precursor leader peptide-binding protein n=1 Tax=Streptomyces sp. SP18CS02 TaxID=3002531 RepID=UPI002E77DC32|nr:TOMM precursor leader peptide-binding protein [Streptomyces sp. SP18CS02]MEE1751523.1 TOMM precursor leader peptide-binding protein [Streptomyces sp. SP18CS02]
MAQASYEAVASTRPRIRRDVLFTETPDGVLFHNADGGFRLTAASAYRFATLLVPHLTGEHSVAELCEGLGDGQRKMVGELVKTLYERDFARPVAAAPESSEGPRAALPPDVARRFAPQIAYADHYADDAEARFLHFRDARVAVLGEDPVARWCALSLVRNGCAVVGVTPGLDRAAVDTEAAETVADGCPVEVRVLAAGEGDIGWAGLQGYDVVVVTGGRAAPATVLPLLRAGIPEGHVLLPAWTYGSDAVIGPLMSHGTPGCWACAALRLGATGGGAGDAAELWSALALPGSPVASGPVPGGPLAAMIGNLLGYEVFRARSGALPAETAGHLLVQDMESLDVTAEPLFAHPRCPFCAGSEAEAARAASTPVELTAAGGSGAPALPTLETARDADELVAELNRRSTLVRPRAGVFTAYGDERLTQVPLKLGVVELGIGPSGTRSVSAFDVHHVAGARMRALDTAAALYAEWVVPARGLVRAGERAVAPAGLVLATGVPGSADVHQHGVSLLTKEPVLVPAGAVRPFGPHNADRLFERTSAGVGAGPAPADAAAAGLLSALAYDALLSTVRGRAAAPVPLPEAEEGAGSDAELTFLVRSADRLGVPVELLDLAGGGTHGVHVLLARSGERWAVGSDPDRRGAAVAALRELLGAVQFEQDEASDGPADTGDPLLRDLDARALAVAGEAAPATAGGSVAGWADVLDGLRARGRDAFAVPTGSPELASAGIHTFRVLLTAVTESGRDA